MLSSALTIIGAAAVSHWIVFKLLPWLEGGKG